MLKMLQCLLIGYTSCKIHTPHPELWAHLYNLVIIWSLPTFPASPSSLLLSLCSSPFVLLAVPKHRKVFSVFWFLHLIFPLSRSSAPDLWMVVFLVSFVSAQMSPSQRHLHELLCELATARTPTLSIRTLCFMSS